MSAVLTIPEIRDLVSPLLRKYRLGTAYLFGSYARGEANASSDIDLVVDKGPEGRSLHVYALGEDLRDATGKRVDVFELSELEDGPFKQAVLTDGLAL